MRRITIAIATLILGVPLTVIAQEAPNTYGNAIAGVGLPTETATSAKVRQVRTYLPITLLLRDSESAL